MLTQSTFSILFWIRKNKVKNGKALIQMVNCRTKFFLLLIGLCIFFKCFVYQRQYLCWLIHKLQISQLAQHRLQGCRSGNFENGSRGFHPSQKLKKVYS